MEGYNNDQNLPPDGLLEDPLEILEEDGEGEFPGEKLPSLTRYQKWMTGLTILGSFFVFFLILFPYQSALRAFLSTYSRSFQLNYSTLDLSLFGESQLADLILVLPDRSSLESSLVTTTISPINLAVSGRASGSLVLHNPDLNLKEFSFQAANLDSDFDLDGVTGNPEQISGSGNIRLKNPQIRKLPAKIPLPISPEDIKIDRLLIRFSIEGGNLKLDGSKLDSELFSVRLDGSGKLATPLDRTTLEAKLCLNPSPDLEGKNPTLYGMYLMASGGQDRSVLCYRISGVLASPRIDPAQ